MKEKKHIDELFKDRFNDFEATPSPQVWNNIQAKLKAEKEDDRKVIPIWWKLGGVAALLALLLTVGNAVFNSDIDSNTIVDSENTTRSLENDLNAEKILTDENGDATVIASEVDATQNKFQENENTSDQVSSEAPPVERTGLAETQDTQNNKASIKTSEENNSKEIIYSKSKANKTRIATQTNTSDRVSQKAPPAGRAGLAEAQEKTKTQSQSQKDRFKNPNDPTITTEKEVMAIAKNSKTETQKNTTNKNIETEKDPLIKQDIPMVNSEVATETQTEKVKDEEANKKSLLDEIKQQEILKKEDAIAKESKIDDRWDIAPNFAPVYYSSLNGGSSIDPSFSDNSQKGDVNISYGVQVSYAVNSRLSVRTGVSNVDLSYGTKGIELGTGPVSSALRSVDYGGKQTVLTAVDQGAIAASASMNGGFGELSPKSTKGEAIIKQNITYYEVPLELKYALLKSKFGINIIGGLSTLFLGSNDISVEANDFSDTLGEANNLSSVSFSTNVGLGIDYKISKKFKFNVEPMFKYQLNPYTDSSVNFKPYYLGVYTGVSYRF